MVSQKQEMQRFFLGWIDEFSRAVEMFNGEKPVVTGTPVAPEERDSASLAQYLWWRQDFETQPPAAAWIGAPEATWTALGSSLDAGADGARGTYLEMIGQSLQGAAHILSAGLPKPIGCGPGQISSAPSLASLELAEIAITLKGSVLAPLLVAIEPTLVTSSGAADPVAESLRSLDRHPTPKRDFGPMLDRLIDLELPMSIALGRAVLPIRDVLKLTAGSVVELDRHLGDYVEVLVNGTVVARGEVVSVKGNYAIRIQEIISQRDRMALQRKDKLATQLVSAD